MPRPTLEPLESRTLLAATSVPLRVNAGGPALVDSLARAFEADSGFTGGAPISTLYDVANTPDDALFSSHRAGPAFTFSRPVANGNYALFLEFADPASTAAGQRTFDVSAEGALRLDDLDVFQEAAADGPNTGTAAGGTAVVKSFPLGVVDGQLDLAFTGVAGHAIVSAIVLIPSDVPAAARPYVPLQGHYDESTQYGWAHNESLKAHSASNLRRLGVELMTYANENKNNLPPDLKTLARSQDPLPEVFAGPRTDTHLPRADLTHVERIAWAGQLQDYLYLGAGRKFGSGMTPQTPLAYENPDRVHGQIVVLFADLHVEYLDRAAAAALIGFPDAPATNPPPAQDPFDPALAGDPRVFDSRSNLHKIGQDLLLYANEHRGAYPATPGPLNYYPTVSPQTFVNPRGTTTPPPADLALDAGAAWIDASRDYVYLGAGKRSSSPADTVLVFENPAEMTVGLSFLFSDGHVEFRELRWALETIARAGATHRLPLPGDATRDGAVNFDDLLVLAQNYNRATTPFTGGDFNYDGTVNFDDLLVLAQHYNTTTPTTASAAAAAAAAVTSTATKTSAKAFLIDQPHKPAKPKPTPRPTARR